MPVEKAGAVIGKEAGAGRMCSFTNEIHPNHFRGQMSQDPGSIEEWFAVPCTSDGIEGAIFSPCFTHPGSWTDFLMPWVPHVRHGTVTGIEPQADAGKAVTPGTGGDWLPEQSSDC